VCSKKKKLCDKTRRVMVMCTLAGCEIWHYRRFLTGLGWMRKGWTGLGMVGLDGTGQGWAEWGRAGLDWVWLGWLGLGRAVLGEAGLGSAWLGWMGLGWVRQGRAGLDWAGQGWAGQWPPANGKVCRTTEPRFGLVLQKSLAKTLFFSKNSNDSGQFLCFQTVTIGP
jgi:hypothetical protein